MKPRNWFDAVHHCQQTGTGYVLVTVLSTAGSAPRDAGSKMLVTDAETFDTIGGGHLEHAVTKQARELLLNAGKHNENQQQLERYKFDSGLGQCCGGAANVLFECFTQHAAHLAVFGAGHVAKALVPILAQLPLQIHWIDTREEMFSANLSATDTTLPSNVRIQVTDDPVYELRSLPENSRIIIMTHHHQIDFDLVLSALTKHRFAFVGMIGSETKARRFRQRLSHRNVADNLIAQLVSPVGELAVPGKQPIEVAVSIAAQIIQQLHLNDPEHSDPEQTEPGKSELTKPEKHASKKKKATQAQLWHQTKQLPLSQ